MSNNPLQALNLARLKDKSNSVLQETINAEKNCQSLYSELTERTKTLSQESTKVQFIWRLRVGGVRGFNEILLPVFHPVYGVPYIPSASIKGAVKAWAKKNNSRVEVYRLLGDESKDRKRMGCVQFLDAFPTEPCLSLDVVNPQWHWQQNEQINYKADPHFFLSMEEPEIVFGLVRTSRGNLEDVKVVKNWLKQALATGIGSRVSAGYGRAEQDNQISASLPYSSLHEFQLWTQGMYGASEIEFRPTALKGMLRYWFRVIALGLYSPRSCKDLEADMFGSIEPEAKEGCVRIGVDWEQQNTNSNNQPYWYKGKILLEAKEEKYHTLAEAILKIASHLGGIGKGSRRPLHWNRPRFRGCHWELDDYIISCDMTVWNEFVREVFDAFIAVKPMGTPKNVDSGTPGNRKQDVLNKNSKVYLMLSNYLLHPEQVSRWREEGKTTQVRGKALELLYKNKIPTVCGSITPVTPSYVSIKSNFPYNEDHYQVVTVFGSNQRDRAKFCKEIEKIGGIEIEW